MTQKTLMELDKIKDEMNRLSVKLTSRVNEISGDIITIRSDPIVTDLWHSLCRNHRKAMLLCTGMEKNKPQVCAALEKNPACVEMLHLSEEETCCEVFKRRLKTKGGDEQNIKFLMSSPVITTQPNSPVLDIIKLMKKHGVGSLIVVDKEEILGIITERDLLSKVYSVLKDPKTISAKEIMTKKPIITATPDTDIKNALQLMSEHNVKHLPVVKDGKMLVGMIAVPDFYRE